MFVVRADLVCIDNWCCGFKIPAFDFRIPSLQTFHIDHDEPRCDDRKRKAGRTMMRVVKLNFASQSLMTSGDMSWEFAPTTSDIEFVDLRGWIARFREFIRACFLFERSDGHVEMRLSLPFGIFS